jgi:hypothetical protein
MAETENGTEVLLAEIARAVRAFEISESSAWKVLSALSSNTTVDSVEVIEAEIVLDGTKFEGPLVWYISLNYGSTEDSVVTSESLPGRFVGILDEGRPTILDLNVDISSIDS